MNTYIASIDKDNNELGVVFEDINGQTFKTSINLEPLNISEDFIYFLKKTRTVYAYGYDCDKYAAMFFPSIKYINMYKELRNMDTVEYDDYARSNNFYTDSGNVSYRLLYVVRWIKKNNKYVQTHKAIDDAEMALNVIHKFFN
jgi:hypothetical protein